MDNNTGRIIKGVGGFYTVALPGGERLVCRPRGRLRAEIGRVLPGDWARVTRLPDKSGRIDAVLPRENELSRPRVANVGALVVVASNAPPRTDPFLVDAMTTLAENKGIRPVVCFNKIDAAPADEAAAIYRSIGYETFLVSAKTGAGLDALEAALRGALTVFTGASGVGKSSILNCLGLPAHLEVGSISQRTQRGRHTTRHTELLALRSGALVADTPGFTVLEGESLPQTEPEETDALFPEFRPFLGRCRFVGCRHLATDGCAVAAAAARGEIAPCRLESYERLVQYAVERAKKRYS